MTYAENTLKQADLWPPLSQIESEIVCEVEPSDPAAHSERRLPSWPPESPPPLADPGWLLDPLQDWFRRREAASAARFACAWSTGHTIGVTLNGRVFGVLLDRRHPHGLWQGWLTAPECDWAGPFDVLLEPDDEPWDPVCGMVQTWNSVTVKVDASCPVLAVLTQSRVAGIRLVQQESERGKVLAIAPRPGHIALRRAGPAQTVLTGTPLAPNDVRLQYQELYRRVAKSLQG